VIGGLLLAVAFFKNQLGILLEFQAVFGALVFYIVRHGYLY
jgi:hypothetical protein